MDDIGILLPDLPAPVAIPLAGEATLRAKLGSVQAALDRPGVSEVCCNEPGWLDVEQHGAWQRVPAPDLTAERIASIAILAGALTGQDVRPEKPICYTVLPNGERLTIALPPTIRQGQACLVVRRRERQQMDFDGICDAGLFAEARPTGPEPVGERLSPEDAGLLALHRAGDWRVFFKGAMAARKNIILAGIPGSGKTTLMESMIGLIPRHWRLVTIEDTAEIKLAHTNAVQLYHSKGSLGVADITADDLAELVLRLYPTLTLFGEIRGREALAYMQVVAAGNPGLTTLHAMSVRHVFQRLSLMLRQHPAASHVSDDTLARWVRDTVDVAAHLERRKVEQPDGSVQQRFCCTEVYFRPATA